MANINSKPVKFFIITGIISSLLLSVFWINPYPYANAWDSNLKVISFFKNQEQLLEKVQDGSIDPEKTIATFPLHKNFKYAYVNDKYDFEFQEYDGAKIKPGDLVIYSNIYSNLDLRKPNNNTKALYSFQHGNSWIKVYRKE